jgi:hypothetical protein
VNIVGQLKDDIQSGKVVIFLGAGASQAAGLFGASDLAKYLFSKAGEPRTYDRYENDLAKLVAKFDKDN